MEVIIDYKAIYDRRKLQVSEYKKKYKEEHPEEYRIKKRIENLTYYHRRKERDPEFVEDLRRKGREYYYRKKALKLLHSDGSSSDEELIVPSI